MGWLGWSMTFTPLPSHDLPRPWGFYWGDTMALALPPTPLHRAQCPPYTPTHPGVTTPGTTLDTPTTPTPTPLSTHSSKEGFGLRAFPVSLKPWRMVKIPVGGMFPILR